MKTTFKFLLPAVLSTALLIYHHPTLSAEDDKININNTNIYTRSVTVMPEASIRHEVLSVSFDGSGMYSLYIEDSFGAVVYQSMLHADGMEYDYDLSGIGEGLFRLILDGHEGEYEGFFTLR